MIMDPALDQVVDRCRAGDREAFDELVARYGLQVLRTARLIVRDEGLAEDVCQETFLKAWRRIRSLRGEGVDRWLVRIAMNESLSAWRRRHRFDALLQRVGLLRRLAPPPPGEHRIDLAQALDRLPVGQRAAVVLHYYHDLSVEATARSLGVSPDAVKSRLKVALRSLRRWTGAQENG